MYLKIVRRPHYYILNANKLFVVIFNNWYYNNTNDYNWNQVRRYAKGNLYNNFRFFTILLYRGVIVPIEISANRNRKFNSQNNRTN